MHPAIHIARNMPITAYYVSPAVEAAAVTGVRPLEVVPLYRTRWAIECAIDCLKPNYVPRLEAGLLGALYIPQAVALAELERFCDNEHDWIQQHRTRRAADRLELMLHGYHVRVSRVMDVLAARLMPGMDAIIIRYVVPVRRI